MSTTAPEKSPILNYKHLSTSRFEYGFDCPVGSWTARLDAKAWGKSKGNLLLYFTDQGSGGRYALSVFWTKGYGPERGVINFKSDAEPGDMFQLQTEKTRTGIVKLVHAVRAEPEAANATPKDQPAP